MDAPPSFPNTAQPPPFLMSQPPPTCPPPGPAETEDQHRHLKRGRSRDFEEISNSRGGEEARELELPTVVEELANMVAVSGEELEDIARDRNEETPELRFLQEKEGELYRQYRARVGQIQRSFGDSKQEPKRKRKSRWGDKGPEPEPEPEPEPVASQFREIYPGFALNC